MIYDDDTQVATVILPDLAVQRQVVTQRVLPLWFDGGLFASDSGTDVDAAGRAGRRTAAEPKFKWVNYCLA